MIHIGVSVAVWVPKGYDPAKKHPLFLLVHGTGGFADAEARQLGPLADNGGPTRTRRLQLGSPCINAGDDTVDRRLFHPLRQENIDGHFLMEQRPIAPGSGKQGDPTQ